MFRENNKCFPNHMKIQIYKMYIRVLILLQKQQQQTKNHTTIEKASADVGMTSSYHIQVDIMCVC